MIDAGVSLVRCLDVLGEQTQNPRLRRIIRDIRSEVEAGNTLSKAMSKYPTVFDNLFVGLIRAGEVGGVLEESLQRLAGFLEKEAEMRRKIQAALTYPVHRCDCGGRPSLSASSPSSFPKFMELVQRPWT